ncbi:hypothetical protein PF005_g21139 [Phytophthora fragariae]|uniref:Uncharacterized protein n=1 Tax=Phytophthora fragariae TaxID=53985 RepID=A0A6A3S898_9STRA|nr:hypothetical protein PF003_g2958 [Phytophthora fragariae]KAE9086861.1 hypothetical protein PF007_g20598 [Phytophthora fragariae]KAE9086937.1 hypothetical protein PF010_g19911 [Phytophthora fragariae]KAE9111880.1 hypothetical protein PF006_g20114 [Phytophthora fragariae]KAE9185714.1 hypothetical protein PF005_g21139 [Phytophthora fragariae]
MYVDHIEKEPPEQMEAIIAQRRLTQRAEPAHTGKNDGCTSTTAASGIDHLVL